MNENGFMRVDDVARELGISKSYAYKIVQKLNTELCREKAGMTQKYLGMLLGFPEKSADVRLAQYEILLANLTSFEHGSGLPPGTEHFMQTGGILAVAHIDPQTDLSIQFVNGKAISVLQGK